MTTGPKTIPTRPHQWGGTRPGAGRPKSTLTDRAVRKMLRAQNAAEKKHNKSLDEVLLEIIYDKKNPPTARLTGIKLWKEHTQVRPTEGKNKVNDSVSGPQIYLPDLDKTNVTAIEEKKDG